MKNKGNPGKKYMERSEYFHYIDLMNSENDIESIKLGLGLFKSSKTFKHYRFSPVHYCGQTWRLIQVVKNYENMIYQRYPNNNFTLNFRCPELKSWMLKHTL